MGAAVFKQPNGLYGRYSYVSDGYTHYNMTKEEWFIEAMVKKLRNEEYDFNHDLNFTDYNEVKNDALGVRHMKKQNAEVIIKMEEEYVPNPKDEFYKQLCDLMENLANEYKENYEKKDYILLDHEDDLKMITQRLKDTNELFDAYKNLSKKK